MRVTVDSGPSGVTVEVADDGPAGPAGNRLSAREVEVVRAIARGRTNQEVGAELFISLSTVKSHVSTTQTKLGLRNRVEIAAWAWENRVAEGS